MPSANGNSFTSSLPVWIHFIIILSCLIAMARISNTMLNRSGKSGHPCLAPGLKGNDFSSSQLSMMLAVGLSYLNFIMLRYVPSIPTLIRVFIMNRC